MLFAEDLQLSPIALHAKVTSGTLYYRLIRGDKELFLQIVNAWEENIFVEKSSLSIATVHVTSSTNPEVRYGNYFGAASGSFNGPVDFVRLAYDEHKDGSVCGWQITPCGTASYEYRDPNDIVTLKAFFSAFIGSQNKYLKVQIDHKSKISDIPLIAKKEK